MKEKIIKIANTVLDWFMMLFFTAIMVYGIGSMVGIF